MTLTDLRRVAEARTKGEWKHDWGNADIEIPYPNRSELVTRGENDNYNANLEFIATAANTFDALLDIADAAYSAACDADPMFESTKELQEALVRLEQIGKSE